MSVFLFLGELGEAWGLGPLSRRMLINRELLQGGQKGLITPHAVWAP